MPRLQVGRLNFNFPTAWKACSYDQLEFYRCQFQKVASGLKAVDLLALGPDGTGWLIEVKDYRQHRRTKVIGVVEEMIGKVISTLSGIIPASIRANDASERNFAKSFSQIRDLRVVFHLEQPRVHSRLFPRVFDPANVTKKLKQKLKPVDPHPEVVEIATMGHLPWTVQSV